MKKVINYCKTHGKIFFQMLFCNAVIYICIFLWQKSIKYGVLFTIFFVFNFALYNILDTSTNSDYMVSVITSKEIQKGIHILKIAVASMATLSWLSTANGLQEFVFPGDNLKALLASFAIQAILVVMSLIYCQLYIWIKSTKWGGERFGKIILYIVTFLLAISMIWSSLFSYVFLAEGIYGERRCRDENIILEKFLVEQVGLLENENEKYGEKYKNNLQTSLEVINDLQKNQQEKVSAIQEEKLLEYIKSILPSLRAEYENLSLHTNENDISKGKFDDDVMDQIFLENGSQKGAELQGAKAQFEIWYQNYDSYNQEYNKKLSYILTLLSEKDNEVIVEIVATSDWSDPFVELDININNTIDDIDSYQGYQYDRELAGYKGTLKSKLRNINTKIKYIQKIYKEIELLSDEYNNIIKDAGNGRLKLSTVAGIMAESDTSAEDVDILLQELKNNITLTNDEASSSLDVKTLNDLSNLIIYFDKYKKYLELKTGLENFKDLDLSKTYIISTNSENEITQVTDNDNNIFFVDEDQWRSIRKEDFAKFIYLLKLLPESNLEVDTSIINNSVTKEGKKDNEEGTDKIYDKENILNAAYTLNRDLLENITQLEKSINYFKYDYNSMAYLAAFLAIFFDLGSFLAGCLFFAMRDYKNSTFLNKTVSTQDGYTSSDDNYVDFEKASFTDNEDAVNKVYSPPAVPGE